MHLSHHASISYTLHTLCGHASILRASIVCAHFFPFSANNSTASSGKHCRVLARTHMLAACAQYLLHARYTLTASFLQALATILSRAYFYKGCLHLMSLRISKQFPSQWPLIIPACPFNKPSDALHSDLGFCLPNLVVTGHFEDIWPLIDPRFTPASFLTPAMNYTLIRGSFDHIWWP